MIKLYLVKDGIKGVGCITKNNEQIFNTNFFLITFDFKSNEGYIEEKENFWKLYTQIGQKLNTSRYHYLKTFSECIEKLTELSKGKMIEILDTKDVKIN